MIWKIVRTVVGSSLFLALLFSLASTGYSQRKNGRRLKLSRQSTVVYNFLRAAEAGDVVLYKTTLSHKAQLGLASWGLSDRDHQTFVIFMRENRKLWFAELEGLALERLRYRFSGNNSSGKVSISMHGRKLCETLVVLENGSWKIDIPK